MAYYEHALRFGSKRPMPGRATWCALRSMTARDPMVRAYYRGALRLHLDRARFGEVKANEHEV